MGVYYGRGDNLVVRTEELSAVLKVWVAKHDADHPQELGTAVSRAKQGHRHVGGFSGKQYLSFHSGRSQRAVDRVLRLETQFTTLDVAEALLLAIDEEYHLADGTLWVGKDPRGGRGEPWRGIGNTRGVVQPTGG